MIAYSIDLSVQRKKKYACGEYSGKSAYIHYLHISSRTHAYQK
jgi:hypothetical protein